MPSLQDVRSHFPFLSQCTYLDTASAGLTAPGNGAAVADYLDRVKGRGILGRDEWRAKGDELRARLASRLHAHRDDVSFAANTSEGLNLFAHSLDWRAGDEVVFAQDEYPTVREAWHPAAKAGARLAPVAIGAGVAGESAREDALLAALTPRTRVLALSQVHWVTGTRIDLERVDRACRANGTLLVVDGVQAFGATPVDLAHVDVYTAAVFKWLLSGFGFAVFVATAAVRDRLTPVFRGAMNAVQGGIGPANQLQYGHPNYSGVYALSASLDFFDACGWDAIHARLAGVMRHLHDGLARMDLASATPRDRTAGILNIALAKPDDVAAQLSARSIQLTGRGRGIRVSPHFYNDTGDIDRLLQALADIKPERG
ncbi:MAG: aminotransferase class V-fold PLP-dependent enzyme [Rubrivivax sp.]